MDDATLLATLVGAGIAGTSSIITVLLTSSSQKRATRELRRNTWRERNLAACGEVFQAANDLIGTAKKFDGGPFDPEVEEKYSNFASACDMAVLVLPNSASEALQDYQIHLRDWANAIVDSLPFTERDQRVQAAKSSREKLRAQIRQLVTPEY